MQTILYSHEYNQIDIHLNLEIRCQMMNQFNFMLQIPNKIIPIIIWISQTMVSFQKLIQTESASNSGIIFSNNTVHIGKHVNSTLTHWPLKFHC